MRNSVGVLGGVGPLATVYFMEMIIKNTVADTDQEHINMLVSNHSTIPDRTAFIMGRSDVSPIDDMEEDARMLEAAGCEFIVIPCNTAHYFFSEIEEAVDIPVLNIIRETIDYALELGKERGLGSGKMKVGILGTEGTVSSGTYSHYAEEKDIECFAPCREVQEKVNNLIYGRVKAGLPVSPEDIDPVIDYMRSEGCDMIVMGCTELSVIYDDLKLGERYGDVIDSLSILARSTILKCGKEVRK